jgi:hypothetical protein
MHVYVVLVQEEAWLLFGRVLPTANAIYYTCNLFGFLIPMFLPRAFEKYCETRKAYLAEKEPKKAEEKAEVIDRKKAEERERKSHLPAPSAPPGVEKKAQ